MFYGISTPQKQSSSSSNQFFFFSRHCHIGFHVFSGFTSSDPKTTSVMDKFLFISLYFVRDSSCSNIVRGKERHMSTSWSKSHHHILVGFTNESGCSKTSSPFLILVAIWLCFFVIILKLKQRQSITDRILHPPGSKHPYLIWVIRVLTSSLPFWGSLYNTVLCS